ncbi:hypothetical protein GCM10027430_18610 [Lysobacter tyrosinilyticus]
MHYVHRGQTRAHLAGKARCKYDTRIPIGVTSRADQQIHDALLRKSSVTANNAANRWSVKKRQPVSWLALCAMRLLIQAARAMEATLDAGPSSCGEDAQRAMASRMATAMRLVAIGKRRRCESASVSYWSCA